MTRTPLTSSPCNDEVIPTTGPGRYPSSEITPEMMIPFAMMTGTVIGLRASSKSTTHNLLIRPAGILSRSSSCTSGTSSSASVSSSIFSVNCVSKDTNGGGACFL